MKDFINRVEKSLIRFAIFSLLLMVAIQGLMTADPIRFYLSWGERMEGQNLEFPVSYPQQKNTALVVEEAKSPQTMLTIGVDKYSSLPRAKILINGREKFNFTEKQVKIDIMAGDTVEIDSTAYNFPIDYKIVSVSSNLAFPSSNQTYTANQTIVMVGKVIVK
ncbi:MAG: hypothetical protein PHZ03_07295 [Syntrophomonas sp.]|nr:hypothetical protein [Syntrophomonas sp.]